MSTETATPKRENATLIVEGMDCASCVAHVEKAVGSIGGVSRCAVNLAGGRAAVEFDPSQTNLQAIARAITDAGYPASAVAPGQDALKLEQQREDRARKEATAWYRRAVVGVVLWLPVEATHWIDILLGSHWHSWLDPVSLGAATLAILYIGAGFYAGAWRGLRSRTTNMDTLIALGSTVAYVYSLVAYIGFHVQWWDKMPNLYFMEATGLLGLISLGHYLEARARDKAGSAIHDLLHLSPTVALKMTSSEMTDAQKVPVASLQIDDRILVRPGDRIAIDGVVVDGISHVDESMLSGEPLPVQRTLGQEVAGGTINQEGYLQVRVTKVGSQTILAQIVALVESAQTQKPPVQRLTDKIAAIFVPAVLTIALGTAIGWFVHGKLYLADNPHQMWGNIANAVCSVLIIACPCALGLAVPAAIMVGLGRGARRGILIRNIDALQHAEKLSAIVFDKTGTITIGKPTVDSVIPIGKLSEQEVLRLAASAELYSSHPLASAVVAAAKARNIRIPEPQSFTNEAGLGVIATVEGQTLLVGSETLLRNHGKITSGYPPQAAESSLVHIAIKQPDGKVDRFGLITISDQTKADSPEAIAALHKMRLQTVLLTGDNRAAATSVARKVGIDEIHSEVRPDGKAAVIKQLQENGKQVAMVGDGINDAPALAQADLGIAIGAGSDIAKETVQIVLVSPSLKNVAAALRLSRATMTKIRQNLFLAFIYNVIAIPLAAMGYLNPLVAAAAMALSDVSVLGNSLLLARRDFDKD